MANKHRTINITVSDNRVERNPRSARPMEERTYLGRVRSRTEKNPRLGTAAGERTSSIIAKLRSRTCIDESWIAASRRSVQPRGGMAPPVPAGSSEVDKLLAQRYGQVRLVPSRISSFRGPYDLRYSTSCQSATVARRRSSSGADPRFRRTIRAIDGSEGKEETGPEPMALNFGDRPLPFEGPEMRCSARVEPTSSQVCSRINMAVQATSRDGEDASEQSSSVNVAVQTQQWPFKARASSARRETTESGRAVKLKRSSSDTCLRAHNHHKGFRHSSEGRETDMSPRCDRCCRRRDQSEEPGRSERSREPTGPGPDSVRKRRTEASAQFCQHCSQGERRQAQSTPSGDAGQSERTRGGKTRVPGPTTTTALARRIMREGYTHRAIIASVRTFLTVLIVLSLAWFLFIGIDVLRDWWSPPNTGWADACKWFILNMLRRITILEKCKCS